MGSKKRASDSIEESTDDENSDSPVEMEDNSEKENETKNPKNDNKKSSTTLPEKFNPMERRKKRKILDKERHRLLSDNKEHRKPDIPKKGPDATKVMLTSSSSSSHTLDLNLFSQLSSPDALVREGAVEALVTTLQENQREYERHGKVEADDGMKLEAKKDDGLENCAENLRYSIRRLIRGVSSSRACARQGFSLALTATVGTISNINIEALMKLVVDLIEVNSSTKGQEARDCLLGRLFAYGALARSGRIAEDWISNGDSSCLKDFVNAVLSLGYKKRYLREPAIVIVLDLIEKVPTVAVVSQVLEAPCLSEWFGSAIESGNTEALLLALKIRQKICMDTEILSKLLPHPFCPSSFFRADILSSFILCFKESTFCQPRVHNLWPTLIEFLLPDLSAQKEDGSLIISPSTKKDKKSRKSNSSKEEVARNLRNFSEIVIEGCFLQSSHDRKHLAFEVVLLLLPRLPISCVPVVLSQKFVQCLMDILSTQESWLHKAAQHFLIALSNWSEVDDDHRVAVVMALQKHGNGRFDSITRGHMVKNLVVGLKTGSGCMSFIQNLMDLFVDEGPATDEPSDQSQTTDENSDTGSPKEKDLNESSGNLDVLKMWVVESLPRLVKIPKLDLETKYRAQKEVMKFLAVQGLFSASLGTEVTSFELQEKFKWPKVASSSALCQICIEQLKSLLADAQKGDGARTMPHGFEQNDLGLYFMHFLGTLCNIPSVSLFRQLNREDENAFKKLQDMATQLSREERNSGLGAIANKLHALRYLLIQLLLQVLLCPGEFSEAAIELVICCKKAFSTRTLLDLSEEEDENDANENPEMMDVLVDTLLSLLPQSSAPICSAVEQVFRYFCEEITDAGLSRMLHVINKDLGRRQTQDDIEDEVDDDDDDLLGIEEAEETGEDEEVMFGSSDDHAEEDSGTTVEGIEARKGSHDASDDESDSGMDDDAMFRMDSYLTRIFQERKNSSGGETAQSQLMLFKLRVLSLLEIYLQRNPGKPQVVRIFSCLVRAFINSHTGERTEQLGQRLAGILQRTLFKAKEYPKGEGLQVSTLESLLEKSLKAVSRSRHKMVASIAQNSTFWILKIIHARNLPDIELEKVYDIFKSTLVDYFNSKKSRLKSQFLKEAFRRHPWLGRQLFGFLLEKCENAKSEYRQVEALDLIDDMLKSSVKENNSESRKFVKSYISAIGDLIGALMIRPPEKHSRRKEVHKFCLRAFQNISALKMNASFAKALKPEAYGACQALLGDLFCVVQQS